VEMVGEAALTNPCSAHPRVQHPTSLSELDEQLRFLWPIRHKERFSSPNS